MCFCRTDFEPASLPSSVMLASDAGSLGSAWGGGVEVEARMDEAWRERRPVCVKRWGARARMDGRVSGCMRAADESKERYMMCGGRWTMRGGG